MNVTIIGAGIVGCAVAHELASRHVRVRVIDPRGPGRGATRASAGMLAPHIEGHIPALHEISVRSLSMYDAWIQRVCRESDRRIEYARNGTLQLATDAHTTAGLRDEAKRLDAARIPHSLITRDLRTHEPELGDIARAALLIPEHGYVAVSALTDALVHAATTLGARFVTERATGVHTSAHGAQVTTTEGTIDADAVIVAAGSWSPEVAAVAAWPPPVQPVRGQLLHLRADRRELTHMGWGPGCDIVPGSDGTLLVGATVEHVGFNESATASAVRDLLAAATSLVPVVADATFEGVRVGLRPMTSDELPIIGPSSASGRVFYATGHYRNGILLAPLTARLVADLVVDGHAAPELESMTPTRFGL